MSMDYQFGTNINHKTGWCTIYTFILIMLVSLHLHLVFSITFIIPTISTCLIDFYFELWTLSTVTTPTTWTNWNCIFQQY